jgi:type II secretion system protein C
VPQNKSVTDRGFCLRAGGSAVKSPRLTAFFAAALVLIALAAYVGHDVAARMFSGGSALTSGPAAIFSEEAARIPEAERPPAAPSSKHGQSAITAGLELTGLAMSGRQGIAIIADAGSPQEVYRVGDSVRPGLILKEVFPHAVVLSTGEVSQRLPLTRRDRSDAIFGDGRPPAVPVESMSAQPKSTPDASSVAYGQRIDLGRETLTHFALEEGGGFRLQRTKPGSAYASMGLRAGDVLRRLNGTPLESPKQLMALYGQLNEGGQGEVEVLRDGRFEVLRYGER